VKKNVVVVVVVVGLLLSAGLFAVVKHWEEKARLLEFGLRADAHRGAVVAILESVQKQLQDVALVIEHDLNDEHEDADKPEEFMNAVAPLLMHEHAFIDVNWAKVDKGSKQATVMYSLESGEQDEGHHISVSDAFAGHIHIEDGRHEMRLTMPVYYTDEKGKHTSIAGILVSEWDVSTLIEDGLAHTPVNAQDITYLNQVSDGSLTRIYYHPSRSRTDKDRDVHTDVVYREKIDYAGMHWALIYEAAPRFLKDFPIVLAWQTLFISLLLTFLMAWLAYRNMRHTAEVEREVEKKTIALKKSETEFRNMIEDLQDIYCKMDVDGHLTYVSPSIKMLGYTADDMLGKQLRSYCVEEKAYEDLIKALHEDGSVQNFHLQLNHKDGGELWFLVHMTLRKDEHGNVMAMDGTLRDYTEVKATNEHMNHVDRLESLGVLAGGIAHDFNNLLSGILGSASLARMKVGDESPVASHLNTIEESSLSAAELCKQMLAYAGKGKYSIGEIDLGKMVSKFSNLLKSAVSSKVELRCECGESVAPMEGDEGQIQQVIMNLITNAAESYGDEAGVVSILTDVKYFDKATLSSSFEGEDLPEGEYIFIRVSDCGCGMDEDTIHKMFEPFYTTKFTGRGLGMSAVRGILRSHSGGLRVHSQVGKGTTMTAFFPVAKGCQKSTLEVITASEPVSHSHLGTVLVVDDEEILQEVAVAMLEGLGYQVLVAENGKQGVDMFKQHMDEISVVLLDMTMPVMDGKQCFEQLKALKDDVKVVLSSGYGEDVALQGFPEGLAGFLQKPYIVRSLKQVLEQVLAKGDV